MEQRVEIRSGICDRGRRRFIAGLGLLPGAALHGVGHAWSREPDRERLRAVLVSSTTMAGKQSLEHAGSALRDLYSGVSTILLINFASLPDDRDAYAQRMQRDFSRLDARFKVRSLHLARLSEAARWVEEAEAYFVSGGNTFLLLKELLDRSALDVLRRKVFLGTPYAGSSAGSNLGGTAIGTTNDFPLVDVPSRQALGILPGTYNPHHPDPSETDAFGSRQWKIRQYTAYHTDEPVFGVTNAGLITVRGEELTQEGEEGVAMVQLADQSMEVRGTTTGNISRALAQLRSTQDKQMEDQS